MRLTFPKEMEEWLEKRARAWPLHSRKTWETIKSLRASTSKVDYGCEFKGGKCKVQRSPVVKEQMEYGNFFKFGPRGCCSNCFISRGYLDVIAKEDIPTYLEVWDPHRGFWREGQGCILPRELRSHTCLTYRCDDSVKVYQQLV